MNGGYLIISKNQDDAYALSLKALELGKPVLFYEDEKTCYYIDTISKSGTDIVLTKGGKTITIEADGDITETGDVLNPLMENIKDLEGHNRFIEGNGVAGETTGFTATYCKWSLSGTHLMIVLTGKLDAGSTFSAGYVNASFTLPQWIYDKIYPVFSTYLEVKEVNMRDNNLTSYNTNYAFIKSTGTSMKIQNTSSISTTTDDVYFRVQFDLLIDAD